MAGGHHHGAGDYQHGAMDISEHKAVFGGFLKIAEWGTVLIVASVGFLTFAFAIGLGWWTGLLVYALVCVIAGAALKMGAAWWATTVISTVLLGVGGAITMGLMALAG